MKISEIIETAGVGRMVPGVNMPKGMHPDEISRQAAKFGNKVDRDGRPPIASTNGRDAIDENNPGVNETWSNKYKKSIKCNNYNLFDFSIALPDTPYTLNESIKDQLKSWVKLDQTIRGEYLKFVQDKFGGDYATARSEWMKIKHTTEQDFFGTQQQEHQIHKRLLNQLSYMPLATFSQEDWHNLWLLTQHADELPVLQKRVLDKLKQYPQIPGQDKRIRYLTDRLLSGQGKTQRYNTQDNQWQTRLSSHKQRRWGHT